MPAVPGVPPVVPDVHRILQQSQALLSQTVPTGPAGDDVLATHICPPTRACKTGSRVEFAGFYATCGAIR